MCIEWKIDSQKKWTSGPSLFDFMRVLEMQSWEKNFTAMFYVT